MIKAVVPVRAGSTRVKNKNIRPFAGSSLLELKVRMLTSIDELDGVYVSSEDPSMLQLAESLGAIPLERDPYYATSEVPINLVYEYIARQLNCEHVAYINATNPLVNKQTYVDILSKYRQGGDFDSIASAASVKEFLWLDGKPINYDLSAMPRSQDLPDVMKLNFAACILPRATMEERKLILGYKPYLYDIGDIEGFDIDTELDFKIAEVLYNERRDTDS